MSEIVVCPWCQMEIVWDEEIGPEEHCPHCFNELGGYRTLTLDMDDEDEDEAYQDEPTVAGGQAGEESWLPGESDWTEEESTATCSFCEESMIRIGEQRIEKSQFRPRLSAEGHALVEAPFSLDIHLCPSCLQVQYSLTEQERLKLAKRQSGGE